jgi:hypothetical protein
MDSATRSPLAAAKFAAAALLLAGATCSGCTVMGRKVGDPIPAEVPRLQESVSTASDVVSTLGPPSRMSSLPNGFAMLYEYIEATERQFGINLEFIGLDWFKAALGRGTAEQQALLFVFDDKGVLRAKDYQAWSEKAGSGFGFQFFFVVMPTVDTKYLWEPPEQFAWGWQSLEPLSTTLNTGQSVTSGAHGIEMRGTPDSIGQRTLEMRKKRRKK